MLKKRINKLITIVLLSLTFGCSIKSKPQVNPYIDNQNNFVSNYKPEDFYGEWIPTGIKQYICEANQKVANKIALDEYNEDVDRSEEYHALNNAYNQQAIKNDFANIKFFNNKEYYNNNSTWINGNEAVISRYNPPMAYTYYSKNHIDKAGKCGANDILTIKYAVSINIHNNNKIVASDSFIIINNNNLLYQIYPSYYLVFERKENIEADRKFSYYMYSFFIYKLTRGAIENNMEYRDFTPYEKITDYTINKTLTKKNIDETIKDNLKTLEIIKKIKNNAK
ncbi:hypothetical protein ACFX5K_03210 [Rickettsiales bacterium LUAb2]